MSKVVQLKRNLAHVKRDKGYRFNDRDPVLDEICRLITDSGLPTYEISRRTKSLSKGVCSIGHTTMNKWLNGETRKPQNFTITWVASALGYTRKFVKL